MCIFKLQNKTREISFTAINFGRKRLARSRTTRSGSENFDFSD